jgi:hypothetical protein
VAAEFDNLPHGGSYTRSFGGVRASGQARGRRSAQSNPPGLPRPGGEGWQARRGYTGDRIEVNSIAALSLMSCTFALSVIRITGHKSEAFQAFAHLFVGGLFVGGFWGVFGSNPKYQKFDRRTLRGLALILTIVEIICFVGSR